jgi:hypothetical protein
LSGAHGAHYAPAPSPFHLAIAPNQKEQKRRRQSLFFARRLPAQLYEHYHYFIRCSACPRTQRARFCGAAAIMNCFANWWNRLSLASLLERGFVVWCVVEAAQSKRLRSQGSKWIFGILHIAKQCFFCFIVLFFSFIFID